MKYLKNTLMIAMILSVVGCGSKSDGGSTGNGGGGGLSEVQRTAVERYGDLAFETYHQAYVKAQDLKTAVAAFTANPTETNLQAAKDAWTAARTPYSLSEGFRFSDGPIEEVEGRVNAWPLDEAYIDYVIDPDSGVQLRNGIINNAVLFPTLTKEILKDLNSGHDVATGYHAIEFLLWGQDLDQTEMGGIRPITDYTTDSDATRRKIYLTEVTDLLVDDLKTVVDGWQEGVPTNYRAEFEALAYDVVFARMYRGIATLSSGELAGERMRVAFDRREKEFEQSCFSDQTDRDVKNNMAGIHRIFDRALYPHLKSVDASLAETISGNMNASLGFANSIQAPFEKEITDETPGGRLRLSNTIDALTLQGDALSRDISRALNISVSGAL